MDAAALYACEHNQYFNGRYRQLKCTTQSVLRVGSSSIRITIITLQLRFGIYAIYRIITLSKQTPQQIAMKTVPTVIHVGNQETMCQPISTVSLQIYLSSAKDGLNVYKYAASQTAYHYESKTHLLFYPQLIRFQSPPILIVEFIYYLCLLSCSLRGSNNKYTILMQPDISDNFENASNQECLQYFAYVRQVMELHDISYWIGNPLVELTNGVLQFSTVAAPQSQISTFELYLQQYKQLIKSTANPQNIETKTTDKYKCRTLLLLGISNSKSPVEVMERFIAYHSWIEEVKVMKTSHFKYYAMLFLFRQGTLAAKFLDDEFGEEYTSLETERILLREATHVTLLTLGMKEGEVQTMMEMKGKKTLRADCENLFSRQRGDSKHQKSPSKDQQSICAICLENSSSEQDTIITILCEHSFHFKCLSQWSENICPLCRYQQHPLLISFCEKCNQSEGLWVCLVCGSRLCCGTQHNILGNDSHIYLHYLETEHRLSMEVESKYIFDASRPAFLHQFIYREVVQGELEGVQGEQHSKKQKKGELNELISQYEQSISEQMLKQRRYFESIQSSRTKQKKLLLSDKKKQVEDLQREVHQISAKLEAEDATEQELESAQALLHKEIKEISDVQKMWKSKAECLSQQQKKKDMEVHKAIDTLNQRILSKKQELKDYKNNYSLSQKLKQNLQGEKVQSEMFLGAKSKNKKK